MMTECYNQSMKILNYTVIMTPDETGGYVVTCPALPGLVTEGDTLEEAREMAADAIRGYLAVLVEDGEPIPADNSIAEEIAVEIA
ncbi:MAG TPA: type II toxin-antitoxin system HicB family antitoxin [Pyrinomonadaceae bacterium]|jgi:predicted RNase H-like HicB family nuclease